MLGAGASLGGTAARGSVENGAQGHVWGLPRESGKENDPGSDERQLEEYTEPSIMWSDTKAPPAKAKWDTPSSGRRVAVHTAGNLETQSPAESVSPMTEPSQRSAGKFSAVAERRSTDSGEEETPSTLGSWIEPHPRPRKKNRPCIELLYSHGTSALTLQLLNLLRLCSVETSISGCQSCVSRFSAKCFETPHKDIPVWR